MKDRGRITCDRAQPPGWHPCTRDIDHDGPCALEPEKPQLYESGWWAGAPFSSVQRAGFPWDVLVVGVVFGAFLASLVWLLVVVVVQ